jgi:transcriptional regulator with XRE-family HTH domain
MAESHKVRQVQLVGRKIRRLRKAHRITQTMLSSRIGIQQSDLSRMENGEYRVSLDVLFKILAVFDMSIGDFFDDPGDETTDSAEARMISEFRTLTPEAQKEVEEFVSFKSQRPAGEDEGE